MLLCFKNKAGDTKCEIIIFDTVVVLPAFLVVVLGAFWVF